MLAIPKKHRKLPLLVAMSAAIFSSSAATTEGCVLFQDSFEDGAAFVSTCAVTLQQPKLSIGNGDKFITKDEINNNKVTVTITLPSNAKEGDKLTINGGSAEALTAADINAKKIVKQLTAPAEGSELKVAVKITRDKIASASEEAKATRDTFAKAPISLTIANGDNYITGSEINASKVSVKVGLPDDVAQGDTLVINGNSQVLSETVATAKKVTTQVQVPDSGETTITAKIKDTHGNESTAINKTVTVDTAAPVVAITTSNPLTTNSNKPTITGNVEAGATVTVNGKPATVTGSTWTYTFPQALSEGEHNYPVVATDAAGNSMSITAKITVDTQKPEVKFTTSNPLKTNSNKPKITGTVEAGATVMVNDKPAAVTGTTWEYTFTEALDEGDNTAKAIATDSAGNKSDKKSITITVDTIKPVIKTVKIESYKENQVAGASIGTIEATDSSSVSYKISGGSGKDYFEIDSNSGKITFNTAGLAAASNDYEKTPNTFKLAIVATDAFGNKSTEKTFTFNVLDDKKDNPKYMNDTGTTKDAGSNTCAADSIEDCNYGYDKTDNDDSNGHAGFDFTRLKADGITEAATKEESVCVRDNITGLTWQKTGTTDKRQYYQATSTVNDANEGTGTCGKTNWRVPTVNELFSIVNYGNAKYIDTNFFDISALRNGGSPYWTSEKTMIRGKEYAYTVMFKWTYGAAGDGTVHYERIDRYTYQFYRLVSDDK